MSLNITREVARMQKQTVRELRIRYADTFGETTNAANKPWLIKRIAWRMQSNVEGDISERARKRAEELASDADVRLSPPTTGLKPKPKAVACRTSTATLTMPEDERLPPPGSELTRRHKGRTYIVTVETNGFFYEGEFYKSLSDYAELARLAHVSRARLTQIMNLRLLAPDLQEAVLFLPEITRGRDPLLLRQLQPIALTADWKRQRKLFKQIMPR